MIMDRFYGGVCYAGIDTDPELKYPKGAGRVAFSNQQSYIAAISARFVQLQHGEIDKRVSSWSRITKWLNLWFIHFLNKGWGETVRVGRSDVWRVSGHAVWWQICALLLRQCDVSSVLLRGMLGQPSHQAGPRIPQASGQGGRRSAATNPLQIVSLSPLLLPPQLTCTRVISYFTI